MISKEDVIAELVAEIGQRQRVYANMVASGKMSEERRALKIATIERAIELVRAAPEQTETAVQIKNLTFEARQVWDRCYQESMAMAYSWPEGRGGGRDMKGLKNLCQRMRKAIALRSEVAETAVSDEEVLKGLALMLTHLPDWYKKNTYTPHQIYDQFNNISAAIKERFNRNKAGGGASAAEGFVPE